LTVAAAITIASTLVIILTVAGLFWLIGLFFTTFSNVFLPLAVAAVMALVVQPYNDLLCERLRLSPVLAVIVLCLSLVLPLVGFGWAFGALIIGQAHGFVSSFPEYWAKIVAFVSEHSPAVIEFAQRYQIRERIDSAVQAHSAELLQGLLSVGGGAVWVGKGFLSGIGAVFMWIMLPVYFAFFLLVRPGELADPDRLFPFLKASTRGNVIYLVREFVNILVAFFRGQLLIALIQGLLFAVGFTAVGLRYGFVIGLALGFMNIIPYLGSIIGLAISVPLAFFQDGGGSGTLLAVVIVFTVVQMIEGYLLTPRIMGERTGLHPMVVIVAIFFWGSALGGIAGMILAIPLTAFLVVFWRLVRDHYILEVV